MREPQAARTMIPRTLITLVVALVLVGGFVACGKSDERNAHTSGAPAANTSNRNSEPTGSSARAQSSEPVPENVLDALGTKAEARGQSAAPRSTGKQDVARTPQPRRFVGRVTSTPDGKPVAGAILGLRTIGHMKPLEPVLECRSNATGDYVLDGVPVGNWSLTCRSALLLPADAEVYMPAFGGDVRRDFVLEPDPRVNMVVHLHVPGGKPFFQALAGDDIPLAAILRPVFVDACPAPGADLPASTSVITFKGEASDQGKEGTDDWYDVTLRSARAGCCCVLLGKRVLAVQPFPSAAHDVTLDVSVEDMRRATGSLRFELVDDRTNTPISGARATVRPADGPACVVDMFGSKGVVFPHVLPGAATLEIEADGHAHGKQTVMIRAGEDMDLGTIRLPASVAIYGTVELPSDWTATHQFGPEVFAYRVEKDGSAPYLRSVTASTQGEFVFEELDPGAYFVAWQPRHPVPAVGPVRNGAIPGWVFVDAHIGSVHDVHVGVTPAMWSAEATRAHTPH